MQSNLVAPVVNVLPAADSKPAIDPQKYINCFGDLSGNDGATFTMTIYVNQPNPGHNDQFMTIIGAGPVLGIMYYRPGAGLLDVGHTFVRFTKNNSDGTSITQVMGFYPGSASISNPLPGVGSKGVVKDDSGHPFNESYSATVSATNFSAALTRMIQDSNNANYTLTNQQLPNIEYNCTDAGITWMATANIHVPASVSRGMFTNTPGDYGVALSNFSGAITANGNAPQGHGPCN